MEWTPEMVNRELEKNPNFKDFFKSEKCCWINYCIENIPIVIFNNYSSKTVSFYLLFNENGNCDFNYEGVRDFIKTCKPILERIKKDTNNL